MTILDKITVSHVRQMMPSTPRQNIDKYWPLVREALRNEGLTSKEMALMALGTIHAETAGFVPISEGRSKYNTIIEPFDLYDERKDLGNSRRGDGSLYKGRGFIQLTGKTNYAQYSDRIGLGSELIQNPDRANEPNVAAKILAAFLKDRQTRIMTAINSNDLKKARRAVNGGIHGIDRFTQTFRTGERILKGIE